MWNPFRIAVTLLLLMMGAVAGLAQEDFDPDNPPEPYLQCTLELACEPEGVAYTSGEGVYTKGEEVTVGTYTDDDHFLFLHWTRNGEVVSEEAVFTFVVEDTKTTLVAVYAENPDNPPAPTGQYTLTLTCEPEDVAVTYGEGGYDEGEEVTVGTYTDDNHYLFLYWTRDGEVVSDLPEYSFIMEAADLTLVAVYGENPDGYDPDSPEEPYARFTLTLACEPEGVAYTSGEGLYSVGEEVVVNTYTDDDHYLFNRWTLDGETVSEEQEFVFAMVKANATLLAVYEENPDNPVPDENQHYLYLQVDDSEAGWVEGPDGELLETGSVVTVIAHANEGYMFIGWQQDNGELLSGEAVVDYEMPDYDVTLTALFEALFNPENPEEPYADQDNVDNSADVNGDGDTDVADVMAIVLYLLDTPPQLFDEVKADVNGDGDITISDAVKLTAFLTGDTDFSNTSMMMSPRGWNPTDIALAGNANGFHVTLDDCCRYTALQMDVTLPEGDALQDLCLATGQNTRHQELYRQVGEHTWRIVVFSFTNSTFGNPSGPLLDITTDAENIYVENIHLATPEGVDHAFGDLAVTTDIGVTDAANNKAPLYDLSGRRVQKPTSGIYISNGKKVIIKHPAP